MEIPDSQYHFIHPPFEISTPYIHFQMKYHFPLKAMVKCDLVM